MNGNCIMCVPRKSSVPQTQDKDHKKINEKSRIFLHSAGIWDIPTRRLDKSHCRACVGQYFLCIYFREKSEQC